MKIDLDRLIGEEYTIESLVREKDLRAKSGRSEKNRCTEGKDRGDIEENYSGGCMNISRLNRLLGSSTCDLVDKVIKQCKSSTTSRTTFYFSCDWSVMNVQSFLIEEYADDNSFSIEKNITPGFVRVKFLNGSFMNFVSVQNGFEIFRSTRNKEVYISECLHQDAVRTLIFPTIKLQPEKNVLGRTNPPQINYFKEEL